MQERLDDSQSFVVGTYGAGIVEHTLAMIVHQFVTPPVVCGDGAVGGIAAHLWRHSYITVSASHVLAGELVGI